MGENTVEVAYNFGIRAYGSSLDRMILMHEAESGGVSAIDYIVKADASGLFETYRQSSYVDTYAAGYFGSEMDFVELWQGYDNSGTAGWGANDLTAYIDQDGRIVDTFLFNSSTSSVRSLGVRDGDDTSTERRFSEHEAEDNGTSTGEVTGLSMSATTNASGEIQVYRNGGNPDYYITGYFKPAGGGGTPNISNTPGSEQFGIVYPNTTYWAKNGTSAPSFPLTSANCTFALTNNSGAAVDLVAKMSNPTGGVGWTLTDGAPGENTIRISLYKEGDGSGDNVTLTTTDRAFDASLADSGVLYWDIKLETGTYTDGAEKSGTITITASLS